MPISRFGTAAMAYHQQAFVEVHGDSDMIINDMRPHVQAREHELQLNVEQLSVEQLNLQHNQNKITFQRGSQANIIVNLAPGQTYTTPDGAVLAYSTPSPDLAIEPAFGQATPRSLRHPAIRPDMPPVQQRGDPEANGTVSSPGSGTSHVAQDASKVTKHSSSSLPIRSGTAPARRYV
jgi:hypothetical protein